MTSFDNEQQYLNALSHILQEGTGTENRTSTDTISVFGHTMRFDLQAGFPALTTKHLFWKKVKSELLWFIEGTGDERRLAEIHYGKPRSELEDKTTIWTINAKSPNWVAKAKFDGDLGRPYGVQWRHWRSPVMDGSQILGINEVDQLAKVVDQLKNDPNNRRIILNAWNAGELDNMALPPCHVISQFRVISGKLSCLMFMRSADTFLGVPFNIASYALLTHMLAQVCDLEVGELIVTMGDAHIYVNHIEQVKLQLSRDILPPPRLVLDPSIKGIDDFTMQSIQLDDYQYHPAIHGEMAD